MNSRVVPHFVAADPLVRPGRELEPRLKAEGPVDEREFEAAEYLVLDLLLSAEDVGVVLRDVPDAQQPVQRPAGSCRCTRPCSEKRTGRSR